MTSLPKATPVLSDELRTGVAFVYIARRLDAHIFELHVPSYVGTSARLSVIELADSRLLITSRQVHPVRRSDTENSRLYRLRGAMTALQFTMMQHLPHYTWTSQPRQLSQEAERFRSRFLDRYPDVRWTLDDRADRARTIIRALPLPDRLTVTIPPKIELL